MLLQWLHDARRMLLDLLYPLRCVGCGQAGVLYCTACRDSAPPVMLPICSLCGGSVPSEGLCSRCRREPLCIDGIRSAVVFTGSLRQAIHHFKYSYTRDLADPLGEMLVSYWRKAPLPADVIVPVPLHPWRLRERGYNQAALLAARLAASAGIPVLDDLLRRQRNTVSQTRLNVEQRRQNVDGAFVCTGAAAHGGRVLLVDDVCTTGATLEACSIVLKRGGAASVWALTLARAQ